MEAYIFMKPEFLFHGSRTKISGGFLEPRLADDVADLRNRQLGVFASPRWEVAAGFSLIGEPNTASWVKFDVLPFQVIFICGEPATDAKRYIYKVSSESFAPIAHDREQWISPIAVRILSMEERTTGDLSHLWRKASLRETTEFKSNIEPA